MDRNSKSFLEQQKKRIESRIAKYKNEKRIKDELLSGDVSPYTRYKQEKLIPILEKCLQKIAKGNYGLCEKCSHEIEIGRLLRVPAAELCIKCSGCSKKMG